MAEINNDPSMLYDEEFMKKREAMFKNFSPENEVSSGREKEEIFEEEDDEDEKETAKKSGFFSRLRKKKDIDDNDSPYDIFDLGEIEDKKPSKEEKKKEDKKEEKKKASKKASKEEKSEKKSFKKEKKQKKEDFISVSETEKKYVEEKKPEEAPVNEKAEEKAQEKISEASQNEAYEEEIVVYEPALAEEIVAAEEEITPLSDLDDINALLESVGIKPVGEEAEEEDKAKTKRIEDKDLKAVSEEITEEKTKDFSSALEETKEVKADLKESFEKEEANDGQFILEGYKDEEGPKKEDESVVEERLKTTRKNLIDNFRVLKNETDDSTLFEKEEAGISSSIADSVKPKEGEGIFEAVEKISKTKLAFKKVSEKAAVNKLQQKAKKERRKEQFISATAFSKELKRERAKIQKKMKIMVVITAVLSILTVIGSSYTDGGALEMILGSGGRLYVLIEMAVFALGLFVCKDKLKAAFDSVTSLKADSNTTVLFTAALVGLHLIISLASGVYPETTMRLYTPFASFAFLVSLYSDYLSIADKAKSVSLMMRSEELTGICPITNKADAAALAHGISESGEPLIYYNADVSFPENLGTERDEKASDERFYTVLDTAVAGVGFVLSLVLSIMNKSAWVFGVTFASFVCLLMPNMRSVILSLLMSRTNTSLMYSGATVTGYDVCDEIGKANGVVVESSDLFTSGVSKFRLVPKSRMALSDAVVYAASTLKNTGSLIANAFDDFISESEIKLPEAEDVTYEDRLGYSSWVAGRRVLVGNRQMLVQHSIECPTEEEELAYAQGRNVMYVVVEGIIAATFIVTFSVKQEAKKHISVFNKTGIVLMISSVDPWLSEDNAAMKLRADKATIKITSSKGAEIVASYKNNALRGVDSGLVCSKKQKNILLLVNAAYGLFSAERLALLIYAVGTILSFVLFTLFSLLKITTGFSVFVCMALQLLWAAVSYYTASTRIK